MESFGHDGNAYQLVRRVAICGLVCDLCVPERERAVSCRVDSAWRSLRKGFVQDVQRVGGALSIGTK